MKNYQEVLAFLHQQLPMFQRVGAKAYKKDLRNIIRLCEIMGHPERDVDMVHLAGTNGKGSVSHMIAAVYQKRGRKVGLYTSPHYIDFRERVKVNGIPVSEEDVKQFVQTYYEAFHEIKPSFFEWSFALALYCFSRQQVDIAIIETGLGGRLDSTNIIHPLISCITNVSYDHQAILGDTIPEIAREKLGIVKKGVPIIMGEKSDEYSDLVLEKSKSEEAPLYWAEDMVQLELVQEDLGGQWVEIQVGDQPAVRGFMDLSGGYQRENLRTAISVVYQLDKLQGEKEEVVSDFDAFAQIREKTGMLGRWQILSQKPPIVLDGAHNISALNAVFTSFFEIDAERYHIVIGVSNDKDIRNLLSHLPKFPKYFFCQADVPRALHYRQYIDLAIEEYGLNAKGYDTVDLAYKAALKRTSPFDALLVCGSIFVVGELLANLKL